MQTRSNFEISESRPGEPLSSKGARSEKSEGIMSPYELRAIGKRDNRRVRRNAFQTLAEIRVHSTSSFPTIRRQYVPAEMIVYRRRVKMGERSRCKRLENDSSIRGFDLPTLSLPLFLFLSYRSLIHSF